MTQVKNIKSIIFELCLEKILQHVFRLLQAGISIMNWCQDITWGLVQLRIHSLQSMRYHHAVRQALRGMKGRSLSKIIAKIYKQIIQYYEMFQYFQWQSNQYLSISILYLSQNGKKDALGDLKVYISQRYAEPGINHNEGAFSNPKKIVVQGDKGGTQYTHQFLYLTFTSMQGCTVKILPSFSGKNSTARRALTIGKQTHHCHKLSVFNANLFKIIHSSSLPQPARRPLHLRPPRHHVPPLPSLSQSPGGPALRSSRPHEGSGPTACKIRYTPCPCRPVTKQGPGGYCR